MSGLDGKVIVLICFGFLTNLLTDLTVLARNLFTHLKLKQDGKAEP